MKTAISIPDADFEKAEVLAHRLGVSRSQLYAKAVREFVRARRDVGVCEGLDRVYGSGKDAVGDSEEGAEDSDLPSEIAAMQSASLPDDDW